MGTRMYVWGVAVVPVDKCLKISILYNTVLMEMLIH